MLTLLDRSLDRNCQGYCRREFLKIGALSLFGGLSLPNLLAARASAAPVSRFVKDKAVVLLFLQGGPSHIETFDPKMSAPAEVRGIFGEVPTALPGITFGATFPKLAKMADRIAVVRSYGSRNGDHSYLSVTGGGNPLKASMSALYTRVAGAIHPQTGLPNNVLLLPEAVQPGLKLNGNFETSARPSAPSTRPAAANSRKRCSCRWSRNASATVAPCSASWTPCAAGPTPPAPGRAWIVSSSKPSTWWRAASRPRLTCRRKTRRCWRSTTPASSSVWKK
jgi:hypothetical protein